jgi:hypothetical protein
LGIDERRPFSEKITCYTHIRCADKDKYVDEEIYDLKLDGQMCCFARGDDGEEDKKRAINC